MINIALMAHSAGVGPSKPSISYDVSAAVSCAAVVKCRHSQIRRSNALGVVSAVHGKGRENGVFRRLFKITSF